MFNASIIPNRSNKDFKLTDLSFAERVIYWTIVLTPVWWLSGIQTIFYPLVVAGLLAIGFEIDKLTKRSLPICNWSWLAMTLAALWTNILGLSEINFEVLKTAATLVTLLKGYFLIFAALTIPFWHRIRLSVITRAIAWMTAGQLVTLLIQTLILVAFGPLKPLVPPLASIIPGEKQSMTVQFAIMQPFFGIPLPRTVLYTADPPILGVCALLCFFICLGEPNRRLRRFALAGSLVCLLISQSRLAWICFPLIFIIIGCFRSGLARQGSLWLTSFASFICATLGLTLADLINAPLETFNSARADSSKDRAFVIDATIDAWRESPWVGWGILGKTVSWGNGVFVMPLGTFSSYAQVLYLHGIFGFIFFIIALISTLWYFWKAAAVNNILAQRAFATLVALYVLCQATNLTWMAIYFWFFFIWLGAILADIQQQNLSSWKQLF
ncbi:hypothetical protein NIES4071_90510 [Calothrix sp. NIES-4071]|nr:hypothetical protein NIES4071_90510 [Calothrix sp. NIES-4071]BAZ63318.1 hypothetical protein NIES4105_90440 [Calothrix sp. NIES-4105]